MNSSQNRAWDFLSQKQRQTAVDDIINYFQTERDETIGIIAAESILDFFLQTTGSTIYNKALDDLRPLLEKELDGALLNIDISLRK